jgi:hypothetical protein
MKRIIMEMSVDEAEIVRDSLEIMARIHMGQLDLVEMEIYRSNPDAIKNNEIKALFSQIEDLSGLKNNGIRSTNIANSARSAWDIHQFMRQTIGYIKNKLGGFQTTYDRPMITNPDTTIVMSTKDCEQIKNVSKEQENLVAQLKK